MGEFLRFVFVPPSLENSGEVQTGDSMEPVHACRVKFLRRLAEGGFCQIEIP